MLVSTDELDSVIGDPDVIVADARSFAEYSAGHIPGAVHMDLFAFHWLDTTQKGLDGFDAQARWLLSLLGAMPKKRVVFYDSVSGMLAARGVWMSMYLSHQNTAMLDGGLGKWQKEGRRLETATRGFAAGNFAGNADKSLISGFEHLRDHISDGTIIDARSPGEYDGSVVRAARPGHIPNAINVDWSLNLNPDGTFKDDAELTKLYDIPRDAQIITYCHGAYRAANTFVALKKLGFENVRVYLGSWGEWGNRLDLPAKK